MPEPDLVAAAAIALTVVAIVVARAISTQAVERGIAARLAVGSGGIIRGAGPIQLDMADPAAPGALLLHGFGDTPQTMMYLAAALHERGWSVRAPLLPGHGRTIREWARTTGDEWLTHARAELETMRRARQSVALVGLSMGGALAAILAVEAAGAGSRDLVAGSGDSPPAPNSGSPGAGPAGALASIGSLVLLAPYLALPRWVRLLTARYRLLGIVLPYFSAAGGYSILDPVERDRSLAYGATTPRLVHELGLLGRRAWAALPAITIPTLLVQSHRDNRTTAAVAEEAIARLRVADKRLLWIDDGGHVITVDHGHVAVAAVVGEWLDAHTPARALSQKVQPA